MNNSVIYKITNKINDKFYIGSAVSFNHRINTHKCHLRKRTHHSKKLQASWNKYGEFNFKFESLCNCPKEYLIKLEQWFIDNLNPNYNISRKAGSMLGTKRNNEQKQNMSKPRSLEGKRNMSISHKRKKKVGKYSLDGVFLESYETIREAGLLNNAYHIVHVCKGKRKTSGGYIWKYIN